MIVPRNRTPARRRTRIQTDLRSFHYAERIWQGVVLSFLLDAVFILGGTRIRLPAEFSAAAQPLAVFFLGLSALLWLNPLVTTTGGRKLSGMIRAPKFLAGIFLFLCIFVPLAELAVRVKGEQTIPVVFIAALLICATAVSIMHSIKTIDAQKPPPRNRFLRIRRYDRKQLAAFAARVSSARMSSVVSSALYLGGALSEEFAAFFIAVSIVLLWCFKPVPLRFFSVCPTCRHFRSGALEGLRTCPRCAPRPFYA